MSYERTMPPIMSDAIMYHNSGIPEFNLLVYYYITIKILIKNAMHLLINHI